MPYTNATLEDFMAVELGPTGEALGLLTTDALAAEVAEVALMLGHPVADDTDDLLIRALARWRAWTAAEAAAINAVDLKSDGDEIKLSQRLAGIRERLARVRAAYYVELSRANSADGGSMLFAFGTAPGSRGR